MGTRETERALVAPRPLCWPRGRGCNVPELPVESALDQVHSQAGASEAPASGGARWPRDRWASHSLDTELSLQPFGACGPLRSQGTLDPSSLHSSPQKHPCPGQPILWLPICSLAQQPRPHSWGQEWRGVRHQKLFQAT